MSMCMCVLGRAATLFLIPRILDGKFEGEGQLTLAIKVGAFVIVIVVIDVVVVIVVTTTVKVNADISLDLQGSLVPRSSCYRLGFLV